MKSFFFNDVSRPEPVAVSCPVEGDDLFYGGNRVLLDLDVAQPQLVEPSFPLENVAMIQEVQQSAWQMDHPVQRDGADLPLVEQAVIQEASGANESLPLAEASSLSAVRAQLPVSVQGVEKPGSSDGLRLRDDRFRWILAKAFDSRRILLEFKAKARLDSFRRCRSRERCDMMMQAHVVAFALMASCSSDKDLVDFLQCFSEDFPRFARPLRVDAGFSGEVLQRCAAVLP